MTLDEIHGYICGLTKDEIRELRNFCDRTIRVKERQQRQQRQQRIIEKSKEQIKEIIK